MSTSGVGGSSHEAVEVERQQDQLEPWNAALPTMLGRVYRLGERHVMVLARASWQKGTPRNVLLLMDDGTQTVRPFRGLRSVPYLAPGVLQGIPPPSPGEMK